MVSLAVKKSDPDLVIGLLERNPDALSAVYDQYGPLTYSILLRITRDRAVAEDLTQELFLRVWTRISDYEATRGSLGVWMVSIARNLAIDFVRSTRVRAGAQLNTYWQLEWLASSSSSSESVCQDLDLIRKTLATLTSAQRQLLELAYFEGCSQSEIAHRLKTPLGTVKSRMRVAVQQLRLAVLTMGSATRTDRATSERPPVALA
jgi:RNA polymerase sigma-70 factor (ECF subfamily)